MNSVQKLIYKLDKHTPLFKYIETKRANWFEKNFSVREWFKNNPSVIDLGSGVGDVTRILQKYTSKRIIGLDITDFRRLENKEIDYFDFIIGDCKNLPFSDNTFETVTVLWTLHHISDPFIVLQEINRILKPTGQLIILEDLIERDNALNKWTTQIYDKIINLEFSSHPHSNLSLKEWNSLITINFPFRAIELKSTPWFTPWKILRFGLLRFIKL
ncbi:MAG: methyltransferase domain-containing protein [Melioribacteraceae bacterium]|nr:methyltransferase domain-containing protein [Melioribacteraceae bacterium]